MPGKLKVRIVAARDLPVMDRASELTDAFVEIKFGSTTYKTDVCRKSLNPHWNSDWYRFEVDDEDLQDEPLQIRVLDHDTYSAHDAIGKVYIDLNPLLTRRKDSVISGWYPIYDTMHGIRGQLHVIVKVDLFTDSNKFRQSSCGVRFFCTSGVPQGYQIEALHGFVEELVVNDDPEYQWIDKIRSMRASNEARQMQFSKLSGQVQRMIGLKVLEMGGNAVIGYRQFFDLEGESGIVVRAIGTSVTIGKLTPTMYVASPQSSSPNPDSNKLHSHFSFPPSVSDDSNPGNTSSGGLMPAFVTQPSRTTHARHSSESEVDTPPKIDAVSFFEVSPNPKGVSASGGLKMPFHRPIMQQESIDMLEYPFFTVKSLPSGFIVHLGGVVSARSVKLLDKIHNPDEPQTRDVWWAELRTEIRSHMRAMGCHAVLGYSEQSSIRDELIILSAIGTAAIVNLNLSAPHTVCRNRHLSGAGLQSVPTTSDTTKFLVGGDDVLQRRLQVDVALANEMTQQTASSGSSEQTSFDCSICHIPYQESCLPFPVHLSRCSVCGTSRVPDILFTTIEPPLELPIVGKGCFVQARICRPKRDSHGEANAKEISDSLPFVEYELHKQLINKLKVKGMNSLFRLKIQIGVGLSQLVAVATATGVYCAALPPPPVPQIMGKCDSVLTDTNIQDIRRKIQEAIMRNKAIYGLYLLPEMSTQESSPRPSTSNDSEEYSLACDTKWPTDTFVLEIDDAEDVQIVSVLLDPAVPDGFDVCNTECMPGVPNLASNLQMFTKVWRGMVGASNNTAFCAIFDHILKSLFFKLRIMTPCVLCHLDFDIDVSDEDEIQVSVTGVCVGVGEPSHLDSAGNLPSLSSRASFRPVDQEMEAAAATALNDVDSLTAHDSTRMSPIHNQSRLLGGALCHGSQGTLSRSDAHSCTYSLGPSNKASKLRRIKYHTGITHKRGIELTPLSYISGAHIEQYTGHLNFFIIRETTSVREEGGLNGFMHSFLAEVMAICRAHVAALGGNALVAYKLTECIIEDNLHKNQSQCLVNVCGDVVSAVYGSDVTPTSDVAAIVPQVTGLKVTSEQRTNVTTTPLTTKTKDVHVPAILVQN